MQYSGAKSSPEECDGTMPFEDVSRLESLNQDTADEELHGGGLYGQVSADRDPSGRDSLSRDLANQAMPNEGLHDGVTADQGTTKRSSRNKAQRSQESRRQRLKKRDSLHQRVEDEDARQQDGTSEAAPCQDSRHPSFAPISASINHDPKTEERPSIVHKDEDETASLQNIEKYVNLAPLLKIPVIAFVVMVIIIFVTAWNTTVKPRAVIDDRAEICTDSDCLYHADEIKRAWNSSARPCNNFYDFVCGAWAVREKHRRMDDLVNAAEGIALAELRSGSRMATKATKLFKSCVEATSDVESNLDLLKKWATTVGLIQLRSLSQSERRARRHPLDLLLDLAINWLTGLLSIRPRSGFTKGQWTLIIKPVPGPWRAFLELEDLTSRVSQHAVILDAWLPHHWDEWNQTVADMRTAISNVSDGSKPIDMAAGFSDLDGLTPKLPKGLWLELINRHFAPELKLRKDDVIIARDIDMLINIGRLFDAPSLDSLTEVFSWIVIETYLSLTVPESGQRGVDFGSSRSQHDCLLQTDLLLGPLSIQQHIQEQFPRLKRENVSAFLEHIRATWALIVGRASWIDITSKQLVLEKAEALKTALWPGDAFFNSSVSTALYSSFPNMNKPFMANLIETATALRRLVNRSHFEDIYSKQIFGESGLLLYRYFLNEAYIDMAALNAPVFYDVEMFAMKYGGLGSLYAKEIAKMYDSTGRSLDASGKYYVHSFSEESPEYRKKLLCNATGDRYPSFEYFTHISGLETAYQAYSAAVFKYSKLHDYRLYGLEDFSSDQIFFLTYCHVLCAPKTDDEAEDMCNIPLRNFRPFAEAFQCGTGSYMNPKKKCRFFALTKEENVTCGCER